MRIAIIGRSELIYKSMLAAQEDGHEIAVIITSKEAPEYKVTRDDLQLYAKKHSIPFYNTANLNELIPHLEDLPRIDIGISVNYSSIISQDVIDLFEHGILNAHGGDLPRYRGNACQAWAILNREEKIGLCIHKMIGAGLDDGDIIARDYHPITLETKINDLWQWIEKRSPSLFCEAINHLSKNANYVLERQSNNPKEILRCYPRRPEDGRIDWNQDAEDILRLINASGKPYAGAFCYCEDQKIIIVDAELTSYENFSAIPGQVTKIQNHTVEVACGNQKIVLKRAIVNNEEIPLSNYIKSLRTRLR